MQSAYEVEDNKYLAYMLEKRYYEVFRNPTHPAREHTKLQFSITNKCNLKCHYCYLVKHGDELFPPESQDEETIIKNMKSYIDMCIQEGFDIPTLDLFSGEIWHTPFGCRVFDTILQGIDNGFKVHCIVIPTNASFALKEETLSRMQWYVDAFADRNVRLSLSMSIDGKYIDNDIREFKDSHLSKDDAYYDRLFTFCKKNTFLFHPMVAAANVDRWIENYEWWKEMTLKYGFHFPDEVMMLEVRNGDWDEESIANLKRLYEHQAADVYERICDKDLEKFVQYQFLRMEVNGNRLTGYDNISVMPAPYVDTCNIGSSLNIRIGDLTITPCHRTSYPQFNYGKYVPAEDGLLHSDSVVANNTELAQKIMYSNYKVTHLKCDTCAYKDSCIRGCHGAQYEENREIFMPISNVCHMLQEKINYLIDMYSRYGAYEYIRNMNPTSNGFVTGQRVLERIDKINAARNASCCEEGGCHGNA